MLQWIIIHTYIDRNSFTTLPLDLGHYPKSICLSILKNFVNSINEDVGKLISRFNLENFNSIWSQLFPEPMIFDGKMFQPQSVFTSFQVDSPRKWKLWYCLPKLMFWFLRHPISAILEASTLTRFFQGKKPLIKEMGETYFACMLEMALSVSIFEAQSTGHHPIKITHSLLDFIKIIYKDVWIWKGNWGQLQSYDLKFISIIVLCLFLENSWISSQFVKCYIFC